MARPTFVLSVAERVARVDGLVEKLLGIAPNLAEPVDANGSVAWHAMALSSSVRLSLSLWPLGREFPEVVVRACFVLAREPRLWEFAPVWSRGLAIDARLVQLCRAVCLPGFFDVCGRTLAELAELVSLSLAAPACEFAALLDALSPAAFDRTTLNPFQNVTAAALFTVTELAVVAETSRLLEGRPGARRVFDVLWAEGVSRTPLDMVRFARAAVAADPN